MSNIIVIGAGIGGLATANVLAKAGHHVTIYEKQPTPGGRAGQLKIDGFTFDTGPSWYLMPEVFDQYFALLGENIDDHLQLTRLDPAYKVFFESNEPVTIHADIDRDSQTFEAIEQGAGRQLRSYLQASKQTYQAAIENFLYTNFAAKRKLLSPKVIKLLPSLARTAFQPIDRYVGSYFSDARLKQIMEYPMVFLGTSPYEAPALYSLMSHMDFNQGVFYPQGGLYEVIKALVKIGEKLGVQYEYNMPITKISTNKGSVSGVVFEDGVTASADIVISNADLHFTETQLLDKKDQTYPESYWQQKQAGPSALLLYLGIRGSLPELEHHNLLFVDDWQQNFASIFKTKQWPKPASIYVCKPSQTDATVAPAGHENVFVLVPAPAELGTSQADLARLADGYIDQLATMTGVTDLAERIVVKRMVGADDFAHDFNSWQGTALGLSHKLSQSALFRPANQSKRVSSLYYVGGNTVPGIGLPMCLIGAELVYKRLTGDTSSSSLKTLESPGV
jgi:phytoene desaturase